MSQARIIMVGTGKQQTTPTQTVKPVSKDMSNVTEIPQPVGRAVPKAAAAAPQPSAMPVPPPVRRKSALGGILRRIASLALCVALPTAGAGYYLYNHAVDRYVTSSSFSVRNQSQAQQPGMGGMAGMAGMAGMGASDAGVVADFLAGREVVERMIASGVDVKGIFSATADQDPIFSLSADATIEDVEKYWERMAKVERDTQTGIVRFAISAPNIEQSLILAQAAMAEADKLVNELSERAVNDATRVAYAAVQRAEDRVIDVRMALEDFRATNNIVDPAKEFEARTQVVTALRQRLSEQEMSRSNILSNSRMGEQDVRMNAINADIANLRQHIAAAEAEVGAGGYGALASQYERLVSDLTFADEAWRAAIARADQSALDADSQRAYLAVHAEPRPAGKSTEPNRLLLLLTVLGGTFIIWAFFSLMVAGLKDRK